MSGPGMAPLDNGLETLFWCGLTLVFIALVHEVSRLQPRRASRRLFLPEARFWSGGWCRGLGGMALLPVLLLSELLRQRVPWQITGALLQGVTLGLIGLCLFGMLRRLPVWLGWLRPVPALVLGLMLARCCWLVVAFYLTEMM